jgi:acetyltransferase-like isoleucine patch superfamily enzyme
MMSQKGSLSWDWFPGMIPDNTLIDETAYIETTFSFFLYRSATEVGVRMGKGASAYLGTMFDVGTRGKVSLGDYTLVHGARIICDSEVKIGDYVFISWNVVLMDSYRVPFDPVERRRELRQTAKRQPRYLDANVAACAISIESNVWIGFNACILPGVSIGEGSIVGAMSVVTTDVEPYTIVAGNPARLIRRLEK